MFRPNYTLHAEAVAGTSGSQDFIQHDWIIGAAMVVFWSFGLWFWIFAEDFERPSVGFLWMLFVSPALILGLWKIGFRRRYRFFADRRVLTVISFPPIRGSWTEHVHYDKLSIEVMKRWVPGKGGGTFWFVMLRGPGIEVSLDEFRSEEAANQKKAGYLTSLLGHQWTRSSVSKNTLPT